MAYLVVLLVALGTLVSGLVTLAVYPIAGVLLTLGGMVLSLYTVASLCGAYPPRDVRNPERDANLDDCGL